MFTVRLPTKLNYNQHTIQFKRDRLTFLIEGFRLTANAELQSVRIGNDLMRLEKSADKWKIITRFGAKLPKGQTLHIATDRQCECLVDLSVVEG